jgi:hypothetical protein
VHASLEHPTRPITRWVRLVLIALLAGVLTTCAVCWAIALLKRPWYIPPDSGWFHTGPRTRFNEWTVNVERSRSEACIYAYSDVWPGTGHLNPILFPDDRWSDTCWSFAYSLPPIDLVAGSQAATSYILHERATGWPRLAMVARRIDVKNGPNVLHRELFTTGVAAKELRIPIEPIPAGFAINSAFYAGIWLIVLASAAQLRATHRRRRGLCASCTYPVAATNTRCPECGAVVHPGTSASSRSDLSTSR